MWNIFVFPTLISWEKRKALEPEKISRKIRLNWYWFELNFVFIAIMVEDCIKTAPFWNKTNNLKKLTISHDKFSTLRMILSDQSAKWASRSQNRFLFIFGKSGDGWTLEFEVIWWLAFIFIKHKIIPNNQLISYFIYKPKLIR